MNSLLNTAVLFLIFNRPDTTKQVFEKIRQAKPPRLYVAGDGPRKEFKRDKDKINKARAIATRVDWPCEVKILFRDKNLGCKNAVSNAITWFFNHENQGIILEDDCLPNIDFFYFCENLLNYYANDKRVTVITGNNFQNGKRRGDATYYFSKYNHCWGWATWQRAWQLNDTKLSFWNKWIHSKSWLKHTPDEIERNYWEKIFKNFLLNKINSWAYPWMASIWYSGGLTATPNVNLVENIGFDANALHTKNAKNHMSNIETHKIGKIIYSTNVAQDKSADEYVFKNFIYRIYGLFPLNLLLIINNFLKKKLKFKKNVN